MRRVFCKPGSVPPVGGANHLSGYTVASIIERVISAAVASYPIDRLLATGWVYLFDPSLGQTVGSYPTLFTISAPFLGRGCVVSVALSLRFPLVVVNNSPTLCCPDFPPNAFASAISRKPCAFTL